MNSNDALRAVDGTSRRIVLVKGGEFSHVNRNIAKLLADNFPDFRVDVVDVTTLIKEMPKRLLLINLFYTFAEYGLDIVRGRRDWRRAFMRTTLMFRLIKARMATLADDAAFTVQTQSLFDASVPGIPHFVYTDHTALANLQYPDGKRHLAPRRSIDLERTIYHNAARVLTWSRNISRSVIEEYGCAAAQVSCVFVGSNAVITASEPQYSAKRILFVGVEWERKGGPTLAKAFERVLQVHPDATLTIVGCSPSLTLPNCEIVGLVPLAQVAEYYQRASIFVLPTLREPFGIVFVEAMGYRLPVIGTPIGAIPDFIEHGGNGFLVQPGDFVALAAYINEAFASPADCERMGKRGRQIYEDRYRWHRVGERIRDEVEKVLPLSKLQPNPAIAP